MTSEPVLSLAEAARACGVSVNCDDGRDHSDLSGPRVRGLGLHDEASPATSHDTWRYAS